MKNPSNHELSGIREGKVFALLSYLSILCIIPLVVFSETGESISGVKKENPFVLKHAKQGLVIFVGEAAVFIIHILLGSWFLKSGIFIFGVVSFAGMISVLQGRYIKIPLISDIADKITL